MKKRFFPDELKHDPGPTTDESTETTSETADAGNDAPAEDPALVD